MNIPDKALEAVLAKYEGWPEAYTEERQELLRELVRADLEAAAPFIAAQALRDAAEDLAQKLHEPGCNWGTRANDAGHLLASADLEERTP